MANHRILVYRFSDSSDNLQESYLDDGEHGAGRRLLKYMRDNQINNVAVVITRWSGGTLLGQDRFRIMEEHDCKRYRKPTGWRLDVPQYYTNYPELFFP